MLSCFVTAVDIISTQNKKDIIRVKKEKLYTIEMVYQGVASYTTYDKRIV